MTTQEFIKPADLTVDQIVLRQMIKLLEIGANDTGDVIQAKFCGVLNDMRHFATSIGVDPDAPLVGAVLFDVGGGEVDEAKDEDFRVPHGVEVGVTGDYAPLHESVPNEFHRDLAALLNSKSLENGSDTPDFILARYMERCLRAFDEGVSERDRWYGRAPKAAAEVAARFSGEPDFSEVPEDTKLPWDAPHNRFFVPVEKRAKEIYDALPYDGESGTKPDWVPHGNSDKQDEARAEARRELRVMP